MLDLVFAPARNRPRVALALPHLSGHCVPLVAAAWVAFPPLPVPSLSHSMWTMPAGLGGQGAPVTPRSLGGGTMVPGRLAGPSSCRASLWSSRQTRLLPVGISYPKRHRPQLQVPLGTLGSLRAGQGPA